MLDKISSNQESAESLRKKGFLGFADVDNILTKKRLEQLNNEYRWLFDSPKRMLTKLGFGIQNGELGIIPISVKEHMDFLGLKYKPYLVHYGFYSSKAIFDQDNGEEVVEFDNLESLRKRGVWGNSSKSHATFLKPFFSKVVPNPRNGKGRKLFIDLNILQRKRLIYPDPEMFMPFGARNFNGVEFDMPGHAFMVFGGIPIDAITRHEDITIREMNQ